MMKKRYFAGIACFALSLAMLLSACSNTASDPSAPDHPPAGSVSTSVEPPSASPDEDAAFTPGTWLSDGGQYYFFDEGDTTGRTASLEDGTGIGFTYSIAGAEAAFSIGSADNASSCTVSRDGDTVTLLWADGTTEKLTYVSEQGSDTFQFYSNQELADLALNFYKENNNAQDNQNLTSAAQTNDDGSVSIQVYENLGDHNSTAAWYTVDRMTATGTDSSGNDVDLAG